MIPGITAGGGAPTSIPDLWTPAQIATALWLDASDATTLDVSSGSVEQWDDKSGNGRHFTSATGTQRPVVAAASMNGLDVVRFDGVNDRMVAATAILGVTNSTYIVFKSTIEAVHGTLFSQYAAGQAGRMTIQTNANCSGAMSSGSLNPFNGNITNGACAGGTLGAMAITNVPTLFEWVQTTGSENSKTYKNGTLSDSGTATVIYTGAATRIGHAIAGAPGGGDSFYDGDVAEIVIVASAQAQADREIMEGYLAHKWGFEADLPALHPYKTNPPTV